MHPLFCPSLHFTSHLQQSSTHHRTAALAGVEPSRWAFFGLGFYIFQLIKVNFEHVCLLYKEMHFWWVVFSPSYQQSVSSSHLCGIVKINTWFVWLLLSTTDYLLPDWSSESFGERERLEMKEMEKKWKLVFCMTPTFLHRSFKLWLKTETTLY